MRGLESAYSIIPHESGCPWCQAVCLSRLGDRDL
jgi:hypothetical protein